LFPEVTEGALLKIVDEGGLRESGSLNKAATNPRTPKKQDYED
jgi:hypothetical protein